MRTASAACVVLIGMQPVILEAAEERLIEEIMVTAQRIEESSQKVPIAVSAFTGAMIEDRRILGLEDLRLFVPNLNYTTNNISDANLSIRGIGSLSVDSEESGVSLHINEIPLPPGQPPIEIYDLARLEVLRGPQGTLYGRNATGGVINMITHKPSFDGTGGYLDVELGDYDLRRFRGALNVTVNDALAFRIAGLSLERDGYTDNLAGGQVPGVPSDIDGRDLYSVRASATWRITDRTEFWGMYERFDEDDDRMFTQNRLCKTALTPAPRDGCEPGEFGLEARNPNYSRLETAVSNGIRGIIPLGARDASTGLIFRYPRPVINDLRDVHLDLAPSYEFDQDLFQLGLRHALDWGELSINGSYQEWDWLAIHDGDWEVGHELAAIPENPSGLWPISSVPDGTEPFDTAVCNYNDGQAGYLGGCIFDDTLTRQFSYTEGRKHREFYTTEIKLRSSLDGRFNYLIGANYQNSDSNSAGFGGSNDFFESSTRIGNLFPDGFDVSLASQRSFVYPPRNGGEGHLEFESYSAFSEIYFDITPAVKLTLGLRYNRDEKQITDRGTPVSVDLNAGLGGLFGETTWRRIEPTLYAFGVSDDTSISDFYGATDAIDAALNPFNPFALVDALAAVPLLPVLNEGRISQGSPTSFTWDAFSGRAVLDWQASDDVMVYGSYSRGYKPGGFNAAGSLAPTYDREDVDAFELGMKSLLLGGSLSLNIAAFYNDYKDLQLTNSSLQQHTRFTSNTNVDAEMFGAEIETRWRPPFAPRAELQLTYGWLNAELKNEPPRIDPLQLTAGDEEFVELFSWATTTGSATGRYVARVEDVLPWVDVAIATGAAFGPDEAPAAIYPNGIPAWFDGALLAAVGVDTQLGVPIEISGNDIPETPEHTISLAASYTWDVFGGALTARWDYYWQNKNYLTIFNKRSHQIASWDQHNATLVFESGNGRWSARAWIRNIEDDTHITGGLRGPPNQDFAVTEPRTYGASFRFNFGAL